MATDLETSWLFEPLVSVGPIRFGSSSVSLRCICGMRLEQLKWFDGQFWSYFESEFHDLTVMCVERRIVSASFWKSFVYRGAELVGSSEASVRMRLRDEPF